LPPCATRWCRSAATPRRSIRWFPVDLVIDHSVIVDYFGTPRRFGKNVEREYERNMERYRFLKWGQQAFKNFRVVPPGTGICHQVNLEYLGPDRLDQGRGRRRPIAYPDTCVGTDSHTTMINGLGVLGWGVGGIEAEAAMLGQPVSMLLPEVIGFKLDGKLKEGVTATDLVLTVTQMLRKKGVVGKFVEFYGAGLDNMSLADRRPSATWRRNTAPPAASSRSTRNHRLSDHVRPHAGPRRAGRGLFQGAGHVARPATPDPVFTDTLELDLGDVVPSMAGPKRPQDRVRAE
jgi:aconitate hydratase